MPKKRITTINGLIVIWQGRSWSVIAPTGEVQARFKEKLQAKIYAYETDTFAPNGIPDDKFLVFTAAELYKYQGIETRNKREQTCSRMIYAGIALIFIMTLTVICVSVVQAALYWKDVLTASP